MWAISQCTHMAWQNGRKGPYNNLLPNTHATTMYSNSTLLRSLTIPVKHQMKMLFVHDIKCSNRVYSHSDNQRISHDLNDIKWTLKTQWKKSVSVMLLRKVQTHGAGKGQEVLQWTPVPFKVNKKFLIDIQSDILLPLKLTKGSLWWVLLGIEI